MKRIRETRFPGRFSVKGNLRYIAVPAPVVERMNLEDGDLLDVKVRWPKTEDYEES